ncbi:MAG: hypothetical protein EXR72_00640 [Myxococcales bacterium]|nr:hypothetical protein [Myxococcales bacterium]
MTARKHAARRPPEERDPDAVAFEAIDWGRAGSLPIDLDPALVEAIRARSTLRPITLRVGTDQIEAARAVAALTGTKYQAVLRRWLAEGASRSRAQRRHAKAR